MVAPSVVTTSMVIKCADSKFESLHKGECSSIVEKSFPVTIDYDDDSYGALFSVSCEGACHGKDTFFDDDPKELQFKKYKNGDVVVKFSEVDRKWVVLMPDAGHYKEGAKLVDVEKSASCTSNNWCETSSLSLAMCSSGCCGVDPIMYECYKDSSPLNPSLDDEMKAIVDKFFTSAIAQPPEPFDPVWEWKTAVPEQYE